jgi:hypothetical protein
MEHLDQYTFDITKQKHNEYGQKPKENSNISDGLVDDFREGRLLERYK